jgi:hypothetical protein
MKPARNSLAIAAALAGIGLAVASLNYHESGPKPAKKTIKPAQPVTSPAITAALDTLEQQLQRRFHDRNNVEFGFDRVVRIGYRQHGEITADIATDDDENVYRDDGTVAPQRMSGEEYEYEMSPGRWVAGENLHDTMHVENAQEKSAFAALSNRDIAIYTAGMFDPKTGESQRLNGPAYVRQETAEAPDSDNLADVAKQGWASPGSKSEFTKNGWIFRVVKVKADDKSCVSCHREQDQSEADDSKRKLPAYKVGSPVGVFILGLKAK